MPNDTLNKKHYIKYRWTPSHQYFTRQATWNRRIYQGINAVILIGSVSVLLAVMLAANWITLVLVSIIVVAMIFALVYRFNERAWVYQGVADTLRRERELFEAEAGAYSQQVDRSLARFVRRCESIIEVGGQGFAVPILEEEEAAGETEDTQESPFNRSSLRSRFSRLGSKDDDDDDDDDSSSKSRFNPFSRSSGSSPFNRGSSSSSSSRSGSPFSRSSGSSPFGGSSRFGSSSSRFSSGGVRRTGKEDPALSGLKSGNGRTGVRFSAYYPKELAPDTWHPLRAYVFMGYAVDEVAADAEGEDAPDNLPEILYDRNHNSRYRIPEGALVTVTPHMKGFQFNPSSVTIGFYRTWHRFDFELRAVNARLDEATNGYLTFTVDSLVVADVPLSIYVAKGILKEKDRVIRKVTRKPYRSVFASFSNEDAPLVAARLQRVYDALGMYTLRDLMEVRAGGEWTADLLKFIDEADVFQLFWSEHAANSDGVAQELQHALDRAEDVEHFIRPVYWEQPPTALPSHLSNLKAAYLPDIGE